MEKLIDIAPGLAGVVAFFMSLISFWLHWRAYQRDKGKVAITGIEFHIQGQEGPCFIVKFVNSGRRPINLEIIRLRTKAGEKHERFFHTLSPSTGRALQSPLELTEGKKKSAQFDVYFRKSGPAGTPSEIAINPIEVTEAEVEDTTGKLYKRKLTRREREEIARQWFGRDQDES